VQTPTVPVLRVKESEAVVQRRAPARRPKGRGQGKAAKIHFCLLGYASLRLLPFQHRNRSLSKVSTPAVIQSSSDFTVCDADLAKEGKVNGFNDAAGGRTSPFTCDFARKQHTRPTIGALEINRRWL